MQGMENAYVGNGVSAENASTTVGTEVIKAVAQKYQTNNQIGKATIEIDGFGTVEDVTGNATVSVYTADFVIEGTISLNDGVLTWGEIEPNVPRIAGMPSQLELTTDQLPYTINATLKGTTETSITWNNGDSTIVNVSNGTISLATSLTGSSVTANITASADGCETKNCEVTITKVATPQVGDIVNYSPSGTYSWDCNFAESGSIASTATNTLSSEENGEYRITQWKVLNYYPTTKTLEIVPIAAVGSLRLYGAQGYNNAVKMLNDACSSLYSTTSKNITARSINEEDFVKAGKHVYSTDTDSNNAWTRYREAYSDSNTKVTYDHTKGEAYTKANSWYPNIHANEYGNGLGNSVTLGLSESREDLIEKTIKVDNNDTENAKFQADGGIQPKQTFYQTSNKSYTENLLEDNKKNVLLPSTNNYWVASRCVTLYKTNVCGFKVRRIGSGTLTASDIYCSNNLDCLDDWKLFPVVSLNANLLDLKTTSNGVQTFDIK